MTLYGYRCRDCGTHCSTLDPIRDVRCGECEQKKINQQRKDFTDGSFPKKPEAQAPHP